jgi:integrase
MLAVRETPASYPRPRLLDRVRDAIRARHYSRRTEKAYVGWIKRYIFFHAKRHPVDMGAPEIARFLTSLAVDGRVAASTQNQALNALLFLYRVVLKVDLPWLNEVVRARRPESLPTVLTRDEVRRVLEHLEGTPRLMVLLLYGAGLRLLECAQLRIKDVDFAANQLVVRSGKGAKDRVTMLPTAAKTRLLAQIEAVRRQHRVDLEAGAGWVAVPERWRGNTRTPDASSAGSGRSRRPGTTWIASPASAAAITCTSPSSSVPSSARCARPASSSTRAVTRSGIRSPRTCWRTVTTSALSRSCSAIATSARR